MCKSYGFWLTQKAVMIIQKFHQQREICCMSETEKSLWFYEGAGVEKNLKGVRDK